MSLMYAQMGLAALGSLNNYNTQKRQAKMQEMQRDYRNRMTAVSAAMKENTLTDNEITARDAAVRASIALDTQGLKDRGSEIANAAAAGVDGVSVRSSLRGLMRSNLMAKEAQRKSAQANTRSFTQQRRNLGVSKAMGEERSVIAKPSPASALLGLGMNLVDVYDSHQPEGSRTTDYLARLGRR